MHFICMWARKLLLTRGMQLDEWSFRVMSIKDF